MAKRKRTDEEQKLFDQLEALRERRREAVVERDVALDALDACVADDVSDVDMHMRAGRYIAALKRVLDYDLFLAKQKAAYDAMRATGDKEHAEGDSRG